MDKNTLLKKYARTDEEKLLLSRICDLISRANKQWCCMYTEFLTPSERALIERVTVFKNETELIFWGGYDSAERCIMALYPDEHSKPSYSDIPIDILQIETRGEDITHRDILGSLMGMQIQRNRIGDIISNHVPPLFVCHRDIVDFVTLNLERVGRNNVKVSRGEIRELPKQEYEERVVTVASVRLDSVTAEAFRISRTKAADRIRAGLVQVNWEIADNPARDVKEGESISLRGSGKAILKEIGGTSRKGRFFCKIATLK